MTKKARQCADCQWFIYLENSPCGCRQGYQPRFYLPRNDLDQDWGWKRRCGLFKEGPSLSRLSRAGAETPLCPPPFHDDAIPELDPAYEWAEVTTAESTQRAFVRVRQRREEQMDANKTTSS